MTSTATGTSTAETAAATKPLAADPWDAPYFGARVYFAYLPTLLAESRTVGRSVLATSSHALAADPWDAPYFGARVYFSYRPERLAFAEASAGEPQAEAEAEVASPQASKSMPAPLDVDETVAVVAASAALQEEGRRTSRRGWLARLFGGR